MSTTTVATSIEERVEKTLAGKTTNFSALPEVNALMEDFNKRFFLVRNYGGHARVCQEVFDPKKNSYTIVAQSAGDFRIGYDNEQVPVSRSEKGHVKTLGKATVWLGHPGRLTYERIVFEPEVADTPGIKNLWRGFPYAPIKGDCSLYLNHLRENVCLNDDTKYNYLIKWMAYGIRHPNENGHVAIIITGEQGVGKNVAAERYADLFGVHRFIARKAEEIVGRFNGHMRGKLCLVADEAFFAGVHEHARILKGLINGVDLTIENKGVDIDVVPNVLRLLILSNEPWVVRADPLERRYLALQCGNTHRGDYKYFAAIREQMEEKQGYEALMHFLKFELDLKDFEIRAVPHTDELRQQMVHSLEGIPSLLHHFLVSGKVPGIYQKANDALTIGKDKKILAQGGEMLVRLDVLERYARRTNRREWSRITIAQLQRFFEANTDAPFKTTGCKVQRDGSRYSYRIFPSLTECREMWDKKFGRYEWPATIDDVSNWIEEQEQFDVNG